MRRFFSSTAATIVDVISYLCNYGYHTATGSHQMRLIPVLLQILMLAAGFSSNRADAMAGAAIFSVLTVAIVILNSRRAVKPRSGRIA